MKSKAYWLMLDFNSIFQYGFTVCYLIDNKKNNNNKNNNNKNDNDNNNHDSNNNSNSNNKNDTNAYE